MTIDIAAVVAAIGALGLASFALVDTTKIGAKGGVSNSGFAFIERVVRRLLPRDLDSLLEILHANWIGGMSLGDQKAVAKSLIKLRLTPDTSAPLAEATLVDGGVLAAVAAKMARGDDLVPAEANVLGRFDLMLTAILDQGYQRADQRYRNAARGYAMLVSIAIAFIGGWVVANVSLPYLGSRDMWLALLCGLLATPLAPISKDLASALQAGVKLAQTLKK